MAKKGTKKSISLTLRNYFIAGVVAYYMSAIAARVDTRLVGDVGGGRG